MQFVVTYKWQSWLLIIGWFVVSYSSVIWWCEHHRHEVFSSEFIGTCNDHKEKLWILQICVYNLVQSKTYTFTRSEARTRCNNVQYII